MSSSVRFGRSGDRSFSFNNRRFYRGPGPFVSRFVPYSLGTYSRYSNERGSPGWQGRRSLKSYFSRGWSRPSLGYKGPSTIASSRLTGTQRTDALEMKCKYNQYLDKTIDAASGTPVFYCLNNMNLGVESDERLGRAICLHSVNGIGYVEQTSSAYQMLMVRLVIVQSRRVAGQAPTWGNLFVDQTTLSHRNLNSTGLYRVLYDSIMPVVGTSFVPNYFSANVASNKGLKVNPGFTFRYVLDLHNTPTNYVVKDDEPYFDISHLIDNGIFFGAAYFALDGGMEIDVNSIVLKYTHFSQLFYYDI